MCSCTLKVRLSPCSSYSQRSNCLYLLCAGLENVLRNSRAFSFIQKKITLNCHHIDLGLKFVLIQLGCFTVFLQFIKNVLCIFVCMENNTYNDFGRADQLVEYWLLDKRVWAHLRRQKQEGQKFQAIFKFEASLDYMMPCLNIQK